MPIARLTVLLVSMFCLGVQVNAQIIPEGTQVQQVATGYQFTEGPAVGPDGAVYFTDIPARRIHRYDPATGEVTIFRENSGLANGLMFDHQDRLLACEGAGDGGTRRLSRTEPDGRITTLAERWQQRRLNSPNDLVIDSHGGIFFTDPRYGKRASMEMDIEAVFYLSPDGTLTRVIHDLTRPNGLILSPDGKTLYVADESGKKIVAYQLNEPGKPTSPQRFSAMGPELGGGCDGMSIDALGRVYATGNEGVYIFNPDGSQAALVETPERPSNCTLDRDGRTLYITARTSLYKITLNTSEPITQD